MKGIRTGYISVTLASVLLQGCATITSEEMQSISVSTKTNEGKVVEDAACTLKNDKGAWDGKSPDYIAVHRSAEDLLVECKKEGMDDGFLRAISRAAGGMWGNIVFGGGIGALIDHNKGTGYDYPYDLPVVMGKSVIVDRRDEKQEASGASAGDE